MAAPPDQFRLSADVVEAWKDVLSANRAVKGIEPVLKELLDVLLSQGEDGHVVIQRHKIFSWGEALRGAALRSQDPAAGARLQGVAEDMRSFLGAPAAPTMAAGAGAAASGAAYASAPVGASRPLDAPFAGPAPAALYDRGAATAASGAATTAPVRLVSERELPGLVAQLLREARGEVIVVAPWNGGLDALVKDLVLLPPNVALRIITRRAATEDEAWHRGLQDLRRRNADFVISPLLHTRCLIVDGQKLLLGAAGAPVAVSKEMALLVNDATVANEARLNVGRLWQEARDGR